MGVDGIKVCSVRGGVGYFSIILYELLSVFLWGIILARKVVRGYLALLLLVSMVLALAFVSVGAASFDGTYNYAYNLNGPNGWETHRVDGGFIVRGGQISSNPAAFSGSVDSSGNVRFSGPSPVW